VRTAFIFNTELTYEEFLRAFLRELGLPHETASREEMLLTLNSYLLAEYTAGRSVLLIIDEAQNLSTALLEDIRMLSNLETDRGKPLQILLVGQPDLWNKVNQPALQQLGQRVTVVCHLGILTQRETMEYITHRLQVAGCEGRQLFTRAALRQVHRQAMGNPRLINVICDEALLYGFVKEKARITSRIIRRGVRLRRMPRQGRRGAWRYGWSAVAMFLVVAMLGAASTFTHRTDVLGFVPRIMTVLRRQGADFMRPFSATPGGIVRRLDGAQVSAGTAAAPQEVHLAQTPTVRREMELPSQSVASTQTAQQPPVETSPPRVTSASVAPSPPGSIWHDVRPGETLAAVAMAQYKRADPMILNLIKRHNPAIEDINRIAPGLRLALPALTSAAWVRPDGSGRFAALVLTTPSAWEADRATWSLSQEGLRTSVEAINISSGARWFEVLVVGLPSADEAARLGATYQRW
jgi:general secretion pathway protein A